MKSPNNTVISLPGQFFEDANRNIWSLIDGQVLVNGAVDPTTANVIELAFENDLVWQKNTNNEWWGKTTPADPWGPPAGTLVDPIPGQVASSNDTVVKAGDGASITDASGNIWSIGNGQVTLNGLADATTANVTEIVYLNGRIWQENASNFWWSKSKPADAWAPIYGIAKNPVHAVTQTWIGADGAFSNPANWSSRRVPMAGDTAVIASGAGSISFTPAMIDGVNINLRNSTLAWTTGGSYDFGTITGAGTIRFGFPGQPVTMTTTGVHLNGTLLQINPFIASSWAIHGNSTLENGATLDSQLIGTASLPRAGVENDGTIAVDASTLTVGMLTGTGAVQATGGSVVAIIGASASETIQLTSGQLAIGGGPIQTSTGMRFQASVTDFGASSSIVFNNTQATSEVFHRSSATAGEVLLYNGNTLVADFNVSGQATIYASNTPAGLVPASVLLTPYDTGHSIPLTTT